MGAMRKQRDGEGGRCGARDGALGGIMPQIHVYSGPQDGPVCGDRVFKDMLHSGEVMQGVVGSGRTRRGGMDAEDRVHVVVEVGMGGYIHGQRIRPHQELGTWRDGPSGFA